MTLVMSIHPCFLASLQNLCASAPRALHGTKRMCTRKACVMIKSLCHETLEEEDRGSSDCAGATLQVGIDTKPLFSAASQLSSIQAVSREGLKTRIKRHITPVACRSGPNQHLSTNAQPQINSYSYLYKFTSTTTHNFVALQPE